MQEQRNLRAFNSSQWGTMPATNAVAGDEEDSEQIAKNLWEQLWKDTMRKNRKALMRARRKTPRSVLANNDGL